MLAFVEVFLGLLLLAVFVVVPFVGIVFTSTEQKAAEASGVKPQPGHTR